MALAHPKLKTYADYMKLPDYPRMELLAGEFVMSPSPNTEHQKVSRRILLLLGSWAEEHNLGEVFYSPYDVYLSDHDLFQPDLLFISKNRLNIIHEKNVQGAPDFVLEIISPGSEKRDRIEKKSRYEIFGAQEYWIVDPKHETITVMLLSGKQYQIQGIFKKEDTVKSSAIHGFKLHLKDIFKV